MELLTPPSFLFDSKWVQGENLQFQVSSSCHHPSVFCLILTRSTELHPIDWNKHHPLPVFNHWKTHVLNLLKSAFEYRALKLSQAFVLALSAILFALSGLSHANIFIAFIINMTVLTIIANSNDHIGHFNEPPGSEKYQHFRFLSISLYNTWFNLKRTREISLFNA